MNKYQKQKQKNKKTDDGRLVTLKIKKKQMEYVGKTNTEEEK